MSRSFTAALTSAAATAALLAGLGGPVLAQDAPAQPPAEPPAATARTPTVALPQVLRDAGLGQIETRQTRHGSRVEGKLADGTALSAMLDDKGALRGVRVEGDAAMPPALTEQLVPAPVRDQALFAELAKVKAVFSGPEGVMVAGVDASGKPVRAGFAPDGTLMRFERGGPRDGGMGPMGERADREPDGKGPDGKGRDKGPEGRDRDHRGPDGRGPDGKDHRDHDGKGPRGDKDRHDGDRHDKDRHDKDRGDKDRGDKDRGDRGDAGPRGAGTPPTPDQIRASLTEAGYTDLGQILQQGPVTVAQATNPEGEPVLVELGAGGAILRELNR